MKFTIGNFGKSMILLLLTAGSTIYGQGICNKAQLPLSLQNGLIAFYPFCGNSQDFSGNGYHGFATNAVLSIDRFSMSNSCYNFDGATSYIRTNAPFFNNSWNEYTISYWINTNDPTKSMQNTFNTIPHNSIGMGYNYGSYPNKVIFGLNSDPNTIGWNINSGTAGNFNSYTANQWYHIVLTKKDTIWKEYINGALSYSFSSPAFINNVFTDIIIGGIYHPSALVYTENFSGKLDDYMIYNRALRPEEVDELYELQPENPTALQTNGNMDMPVVIYPNPVIDRLQITAQDLQTTVIKVSDVLGKDMHVLSTLTGSAVQLNTEHLQPGIYFLSITGTKGVCTKKFLKK